jgi:hypothetical protein
MRASGCHKAVASVWLGVGLVLIASGSASCASRPSEDSGQHGGSGITAGTDSLPAITVRRTGGLAGVDDQLVVDTDGAWVTTDKAGGRRTGHLTAANVAAVRALATDPHLATEADRPTTATRCQDAFDYAVTIGAVRIRYADCPTDAARPRATIALVSRLRQATA